MIKTVEIIRQLERYSLFTENDVAKLVNKKPGYVRTFLYRLSRRKLIKKIERGKYTLHEDAMMFATDLVVPSYISLWTAFKYYGMLQQQPFNIFVVSSKPRKPVQFENVKIIFLFSRHNMFGYKKQRYSGFDIFIADREKAIIDALLFKLPVQDIYFALSNEDIDLKKLSEYAMKIKNKSLIKRLGYMLEKKSGESYGLMAMDNNYIKLDYLSNKKGEVNSKWKLVVNADL